MSNSISQNHDYKVQYLQHKTKYWSNEFEKDK